MKKILFWKPVLQNIDWLPTYLDSLSILSSWMFSARYRKNNYHISPKVHVATLAQSFGQQPPAFQATPGQSKEIFD